MLLRIAILFILGTTVIPRVQTDALDLHGQASHQERDTFIPKAESASDQRAAIDVLHAEPPMAPITMAENTEETSLATATIPDVTSAGPLRPFFECDFSSECFASGQLAITNGSEFNPTDVSEPPRAPSSDVSSILLATSNNERCAFPFRPQLDGSSGQTAWSMSFCYKNRCPTPSGTSATCSSGNYGLVSLDASETNRTISQTLKSQVMTRDEQGEQCLRFYYYFTVYEQQDWGQQIEVLIHPEANIDQPISIDKRSFQNMEENKWNFREVTFNSTFKDYSLIFFFAVTTNNRTEDVAMNKTIHFALDNLEVYDYNCSYLPRVTTPMTSTTTTVTTVTTTTANQATPPSKPSSTNLGLILGLTFGLGLPVLLIAIGGAYFYAKKRRDSPVRRQNPVPMVTLTERRSRRSDAGEDRF